MVILMEIITGKDFEDLRELYVLSFASSKYYDKRYHKKGAPLGSSNTWDHLKSYNRCSEYYCFETIKTKSQIYLMWDTNDNCEIRNPDYWKYPRYSMLYMTPSEFFEYYDTFPEDIYIFDSTFDWTVILTHEDYREGKRYCLKM